MIYRHKIHFYSKEIFDYLENSLTIKPKIGNNHEEWS